MKAHEAELKRIKDHRTSYFPVLRRMMELYVSTSAGQLPVNLNDDRDVLIILELIDLEYLNHEAFNVSKRFGTIEDISFNGLEPLTETGKFVLRNHDRDKKKRVFISIGALLFIIMVVFFLCGVLSK